MTAIRQRDANKSGDWRLPVWGAFAFILTSPLVAMQFAEDVCWDTSDFAAGAAVLFALASLSNWLF